MSKRRTAVIMQPTYLPWIGYFDLMDQADVFVFLDSVQFAKRTWQQRNRIKTPQGAGWLTVPVLTKGKYHQIISEVQIDETRNFPNVHLKTISLNYSKAPYFKIYFSQLEKILNRQQNHLVDLNIELISWIRKLLAIETKLVRSSALDIHGIKTRLLISLCQRLDCTRYLSPQGARTYIGNGDLFKKNNIELSYQLYQHPKYQQIGKEFIPQLSIIDLLFNEGEKSIFIIKSGRQ